MPRLRARTVGIPRVDPAALRSFPAVLTLDALAGTYVDE